MECQHFIILIILSVTVFSFVIMSLRRTKFEEKTVDIQKKIERAKNLLISGNSKKARDILDLSLSELLSWKKVPDLVIKEKYQELSTEINILLHDIEQEGFETVSGTFIGVRGFETVSGTFIGVRVVIVIGRRILLL